MPNGTLPLIGPQARLNHDELSDVAALAAVTLECPEWKNRAGGFGILPHLWLGEHGKERFERLPDIRCPPRDQVHSTREILRMEGPQNSALVVAARLPHSTHEHQDFTSYELTLDDHRVVVDSGGYSPEETAYFPLARAHNVLLVDGRDPQWARAEGSREIEFERIRLDCARAQISDCSFAFLGVRHSRAWFRLAENDWLILDRLEGQGVHHCTSLTHFYPSFELMADDGRIVARSRGRSILVMPVGSAEPRASFTRGDHPQFAGWYSPELGVKFAAPVLILDWAEVELPWVGGTLISSRANQSVRQLNADAGQACVTLEIAGRTYECGMK
jgi:hypothetical protein